MTSNVRNKKHIPTFTGFIYEPTILDSHGSAPSQYPSWDDEDEEDEDI
ncbi:MAG: hypothetical protein AAGG00_16995 [Cyanobacteria bacterium P01_H01_bin.150]